MLTTSVCFASDLKALELAAEAPAVPLPFPPLLLLAAAESSRPSPTALAVAFAVFMLVLCIGVMAVRAWYRSEQANLIPDRSAKDDRKEDLVSLVHVARYMSEQSDALERERAARVSSESALDRSQSLLERTLSERLQLGRTLHDDTCQVLYGVTLHLDALRTHVSARAPDLEPGLARSLEQLRTLNRRVRSYVDALETQPLPESSFRSVCAEATAPFSGIPGIRFEVRTPQSDSPLRPDFAEDVVHVLRESVSNAVRHGKADRIEICVEHTQNETSLAIRDNGCGFDPAAKGGGHGLSNLKARAERTHGRLTIESFLGKGTLITFTWPRQ